MLIQRAIKKIVKKENLESNLENLEMEKDDFTSVDFSEWLSQI